MSESPNYQPLEIDDQHQDEKKHATVVDAENPQTNYTGNNNHKNENTKRPAQSLRQFSYAWRQPSAFFSNNSNTDDDAVNNDGTQKKKEVELLPLEDDPNVDGGYAWLILITSFFTIVLISSIFYYFGVFVPIYVDEFGASQSSVAWVGSIGVCFLSFMGIWAGTLADYFGNHRLILFGGLLLSFGLLFASFAQSLWVLYLTQGLMVGIGGCLGYTSAVGVVSQWFHKKRGFAVGVTVAGSGLGQFAMSLVTKKLMSIVGWRRTLQYLSLIHGVGLILCACIIRRRIPTKTVLSFQSSFKYFQDHNFRLLFFMQVCNSLGFYMPSTFIVIYCIKQGLSSGQGVLLLSLMGASSAFGRVTMGLIADRVGKLTMLRVCMTVSAAIMFAWIGCRSFGSVLVFVIIYGIFSGGYISLTPSVSAELFGVKSISTIVGLVYSGTAVGNLLCAPIGGFFYDAYKSYTPAILFAACCWSVGASLVFFTDTKYSSNFDREEDVADKKTNDDSDSNASSATKEINTEVVAVPENEGVCEEAIGTGEKV